MREKTKKLKNEKKNLRKKDKELRMPTTLKPMDRFHYKFIEMFLL